MLDQTKKITIISKLMRLLEGLSIDESKDILYTLDKFITDSQVIKENKKYEESLPDFLRS